MSLPLSLTVFTLFVRLTCMVQLSDSESRFDYACPLIADIDRRRNYLLVYHNTNSTHCVTQALKNKIESYNVHDSDGTVLSKGDELPIARL